MRSFLSLFLLVVSLMAGGAVQAGAPADLVFENGRIWTGVDAGFADFAAVSDGRFSYVGVRDETYIGPNTERVDLAGAMAAPGLVDGHLRLLEGGRTLMRPHVDDTPTRASFLAAVRAIVDQAPESGPVIIEGWRLFAMDLSYPPSRVDLDPILRARPLLVKQSDGETAVANTAALAAAGLLDGSATIPPRSDVALNAESGQPTGYLRGDVVAMVEAALRPAGLEADVEALRRGMQAALDAGLTTVVDFPAASDLPVYAAAAATSELPPLRVVLYPRILTDEDATFATIDALQAAATPFTVRGAAFPVDGVLTSDTMHTLRGYHTGAGEAPGWNGLLHPGMTDGSFIDAARAARARGLEPCFLPHGDRAVGMALGAASQVEGRVRLDGAELFSPNTHLDMIRRPVALTMYPQAKAYLAPWIAEHLGPRRGQYLSMFRRVLNSGIVMGFGTGWPRYPLKPFEAVGVASFGRTVTGDYHRIEECLTIGEALRCFTYRSAANAGVADVTGAITPGRAADLIVLSESAFIDGSDWRNMHPTAVYAGGRRVDSAVAAGR